MAEANDLDEAKAEADQTRDWDAEVLNGLMGSPKGRYWMERLLDRCGSRQPRFLGDGDALGAAKRDGKAEIGDFLEDQLEQHCPDRFLQMIRDRRARLGRLRKKIEDDEALQRRQPAKGLTTIDEMADAQFADASRPKPKPNE
jgi:hypothetical protein